MKLEKLKVEKQFKNYIELCKALGVESAKGGRNRKLQQDYFRRFFEWEVDGRKITITKIRPEPIEFVETRGGANNNVYMQHIDPILTSCFASMECKETYVTINQLAERSGIINSNYRELSYSKEEFVDYLKETNGNVNETAVNNVFYSINDIVTRAVTSSMDRLVKAGVIDYENDYIIHERSQEDEEEYTEPRLADKEEVKVIIESENAILREMNIEKADLRDSDKLRKEYYDRVSGLVIKRLDYIVYYYKGYKVTINPFIEVGTEDIVQHRADLNKVVMERVNNRNIRRKSKMENKFGELVFGEPNLRLFERNILEDNYLTDTEIVIDYLLNPNSIKVKFNRRIRKVEMTLGAIITEAKEDLLKGKSVPLEDTLENVVAIPTKDKEKLNILTEVLENISVTQSDKENIDVGKHDLKEIEVNKINLEKNDPVMAIFAGYDYIAPEETEMYKNVKDNTIWAFNVTDRKNDLIDKPVDEVVEKIRLKNDFLYGDFVGSELPASNFFSYDKETGKYIFL